MSVAVCKCQSVCVCVCVCVSVGPLDFTFHSFISQLVNGQVVSSKKQLELS